MVNSYIIHRHLTFDSFNHFFSAQFIRQTWQRMKPDRRKRDLGLAGFIWLGLFVAAHTNLANLQEIFDMAFRLPQSMIPLSFVTVSAFCQYRKSFSLKILFYIWHDLIFRVYQLYPPQSIRWHGFRLLAIDGTSLNLVEALWPHFGALKGCRGVGPAQAYLVVLYDLVTRIPLTFRIGPAIHNAYPRLLFKRLMKHLKADDLLVIDLGFYSIEIFALLQAQGVNFIIPMRHGANRRLVKRFGKNDGLYRIKAPKYWHGHAHVPEFMTVRIITVYHDGFRARSLVTSLLDAELYTYENIDMLYHQRWHIETFFREFKHSLHATNWHARNLHSFYTEIIFQMLLVILTRLAMADAAKQTGIPMGQLSFSRCLAEIRYFLAMVVHLPVHRWPKIYKELLIRLSRLRIDIRPNRHFERDTQKRRQKSRLRYNNKLRKAG